MEMNYRSFIERKLQIGSQGGFTPIWLPDYLMDFQSFLVNWSIKKGRAAILSGCGTGKTPMQLVFAENCIRTTNKPALIVTPIAVGQQTIKEADKFGIKAKRTRDGKWTKEKCVWVTNYEQLHKYDPSDFCCVVGDESSAIKDAKTETKDRVVEFMRTVPYRLLCTATAAPNDYWELGTSSEALGYLGFRDMITTFFKQETSKDHLGWGRTKYRFRGHAEEPFWAWVCSWARSMRMPSDLGFSDDKFNLPPLVEQTHIVATATARPGMLFSLPATDMREERAERRHSLKERCEKAVALAEDHDGCSVLWCEMNCEGDMLTNMLEDCVQVSGSMPDDAKEDALIEFTNGQVKRLVIKPKIGAWGLNWQHCSNVISFPSHSFERDYQLVRRCWRFGQTNPVKVHRIVCEGEQGIIENLKRKEMQANRMFESIVRHMNEAMHLAFTEFFPEEEELPAWL